MKMNFNCSSLASDMSTNASSGTDVSIVSNMTYSDGDKSDSDKGKREEYRITDSVRTSTETIRPDTEKCKELGKLGMGYSTENQLKNRKKAKKTTET